MSSARDNFIKAMDVLATNQGVAWQPTAMLRWWESRGVRTLQQAWVSQGGTVDWRDVPVVYDPSAPVEYW